LLGNRRRCGNVDDERDAFLLGHLGNGGARAGIERAHEKLRAVADELLGAGAGDLHIGLGVRIHDGELGQPQLLEDWRRNLDAPLAVLTDAGLGA
jgi:hypothetical protein